MFLKTYRVYLMGPLCLMFAGQPAKAQTDSLFLSVDQLFERGVQHSLQLQADALKEAMAQERTRTARTSSLPDLQVGLKGGFVGQPVVWERGGPARHIRIFRTGHRITPSTFPNHCIKVARFGGLSIRQRWKNKLPSCRH